MVKQDYRINVLAALNAYGVEYSDYYGGCICLNGEKPGVVIDYRRKHFAEDAKKFLSDRPEEGGKGTWRHMRGYAYIQDGEDSIIVLSRSYDHTEEDLIEWAHWCGFETFEEAQYGYGDIPGCYTYLGVRVKKEDLENFVHEVAPYCW